MHISLLRLKGFKSFADETEIRFSKGITVLLVLMVVVKATSLMHLSGLLEILQQKG